MSYNQHPNYSGQPVMGNGSNNDSIEHISQNPFAYPYLTQQRSISPESSKEGDSSDTLRDDSDLSMSRRESYTFPQVPSTARPPLGLGRAHGNRTLSDLYDESPPGTPRDSSFGPPPKRPWLSASRPESEATLMGISQSPTPYSSQNSPYVRRQLILLHETFANR